MNGHIKVSVVALLLFKPEVISASRAVLVNPVTMLAKITRAKELREYLMSREHFAINETTP
jgi:hypothetical protein